jgi:nucleoside-diphosphate-sugar epimerase
MRKALVCGAGGFIGSHLVKRLKKEGYWVRGIDLKYPEFSPTEADDIIIGDLRDPLLCRFATDLRFDEIYQLAADMGGAGYIFTGENDADVMHNSATINLNMLDACHKRNIQTIFYSSSACVYPAYNQTDPDNPKTSEDSTYPAAPDSEYGWEKLFSERLYLSYKKNYGINVKIARFHNIYGTEGTWDGGKEKAPAALCRKVAMVKDGGTIEIWGDGKQTRSFLYIDACLEGIRRLVNSDQTKINHIPGPLGVRGRNSDNDLIRQKLGYDPKFPLSEGIEITYRWIEEQVKLKYKL